MIREIKFYKNYFIEFYLTLDYKDQEKIDYVLNMVCTLHQVPVRFLKHIQDSEGLYEIRISHGRMAFRIFCCFDKDNIIILFNGFLKKQSKTPKTELDLAIRLMNQYFNEKRNKS
jgi:phage-related protein